MDKFLSLAKSNRALGKQLLHQLLVDLVTAAEADVLKGTEQRLSDLKENWLKEIVVGVCKNHVPCKTSNSMFHDKLIKLANSEIYRVLDRIFCTSQLW